MDVVIFDGFRCPIFLREDEVHVFPIEGIYAVIEVKSSLDSNALIDCTEKIQSVKRMPKDAYIKQPILNKQICTLFGGKYHYFPTVGFVFAFDSIGLDKLLVELSHIYEDKDISLENRIDTICILRKGIITNVKEGSLHTTPDPDSRRCFIEEPNKSLLLFYLLVMNVLTQTWMHPVDVMKYAKDAMPLTGKWF